jgi:hypothetical protein
MSSQQDISDENVKGDESLSISVAVDNNPISSTSTTKKRTYKLAFKKEVIDFVDQGNTVYKAAAHFGQRDGCNYDDSLFYQWYKKKDHIRMGRSSMKRAPGGGRKVILGELEKSLMDEINEMKALKTAKVTRKYIAERALILASANNIPLRASPHWVSLFLERHGLLQNRLSNEQLDEFKSKIVPILEEFKEFLSPGGGIEKVFKDLVRDVSHGTPTDEKEKDMKDKKKEKLLSDEVSNSFKAKVLPILEDFKDSLGPGCGIMKVFREALLDVSKTSSYGSDSFTDSKVDSEFPRKKKRESFPENDEAKAIWIRVWNRELDLLRRMGFEDETILIPLLREHIRVPASREADLTKSPYIESLERIVVQAIKATNNN